MPRPRSRFLLIATVVLLLAGVWFWMAPRRAWDRFLRALATADAESLERVVDFPQVRAHLKDDLRYAVDERGPASAIAGLAFDPVIDMMVSPAGLEQLVTSFGTRDADIEQRTVVSYKYRSPSRVDVHIRSSVDPESAAGVFTFERSGLSWRLVRVWSDRLATSAENS